MNDRRGPVRVRIFSVVRVEVELGTIAVDVWNVRPVGKALSAF